MDWITGSDDETRDTLITWLSGAAGAGKSAIGQSVAERCFAEGRLLASFFFGRLDPTRNHSRSLVATIAYQLCSTYPDAQPFITSTIDRDPLIFSRSLVSQFIGLIVEPLSRLTGVINTTLPRLIIVDGLDECLDIKAQQEIINTLFDVTQRSPFPILFLVCSRPENQISSTFSSTKMKPVLTKLFLDDNYVAREDIELYLRDNFAEIKSSHVFKNLIPATWPTDGVINTLVKKSSGQFIYAATVVRYTQSSRHMPHYRLDALLNLRPPFRDMPFAELDAVYMHVFSAVDDIETALEVLALLVIHVGQSVFPVSEMEKFLDLEPGYIHITFLDLGSLIEFKEEMDIFSGSSRYFVRLLHASLVDFLLDPKRSKDFSFDPRIKHTQQVLQVLRRLTTAAQTGGWPNNTSILSCFTFLHFDQYDLLLSYDHADVLENFSLPSTFLFMLSQEGDLAQIGVYITEFLRPLFRGLQLSDDPEIQNLHLFHRNDFWKFILSQLQDYFSEDFEFNFQFFLAHMHPIGHQCLPQNFWSITFQRHPKTLRANVLEYVILTRFPNYSDGELVGRKPSWTRAPRRVREEIYARAALYCFEYLCNCKGQDSKSVFNHQWAPSIRERTSRFWRSRRRSGRDNSIVNNAWILATRPSSMSNPTHPKKFCRSQDIVHDLRYRYSDFNFFDVRDLQMRKERSWSARYPQILAYLNYFLPRSASNPLLAQKCRDRVFPLRSLDLPDEMRRLRRRIIDYLERFSTKDSEQEKVN